MGLFKPAWTTTNPKRAKRAIDSLSRLDNNDLIVASLEAPLEEVALAAFGRARHDFKELVHTIVHTRHVTVARRAVNILAKSPSGDGWLTTALLIKEGQDGAREDAIAHIGATSLLEKISEESESNLSRRLATQKLRHLEQANDRSSSPETLAQLSSLPDANIVMAVALNPSTAPETLVELLNFKKKDDRFLGLHGSAVPEIRRAAARNHSTPYGAIVEADKRDPKLGLLSIADSTRSKPEVQAPKPEWALSARTRGDVSPNNKSYLFLHAFDDSAHEQLLQRILAFENGRDYAIWTTTDPSEVFARIHDVEFDRMRVFLPVVTPRYLALVKQALSEEGTKPFFEQLQERGIAVIPLYQNEEVIFEFTHLFGEMHGITLTLPTAYDMIEVQLERFTTNANWGNEQLRKAFARRLFMSYRKKDRQHLFGVMRDIHDTPTGKDASIWFDDFLVAGNDFNEEISQQLGESEAMILLVTEHLMEGDNYVKQIEYPQACKMNKQVVPVEAVETDRTSLSQDYANLSEPVWHLDHDLLETRLREAFDLSGPAEAPDIDGALRSYLQGICFLYAVMVEKDVARALTLLKSAADGDVADAAEQLALMYTMGFGVTKDADEALSWKLRAYDLITSQVEPEGATDSRRHTVDRLRDLLYGDDGLVVLLGSRDRYENVREVTEHFVSLIERHHLDAVDPRYELWQLEALVMQADALRYGATTRQLGTKESRQAVETIDAVIGSLNGLPNSLARERTRLEAVAYATKADLTPLYGAEAVGPIEADYQHAIALFERLEAAGHDYETAKLLRSACGNLASLKKDVVKAHGGADAEEMRAAWKSFVKAIGIARRVARENPATNNLETLVTLIFEGTQLLSEVSQAIPYWDEGLECIEKLEQLGDESLMLSRIKHTFKHARDFE